MLPESQQARVYSCRHATGRQSPHRGRSGKAALRESRANRRLDSTVPKSLRTPRQQPRVAHHGLPGGPCLRPAIFVGWTPQGAIYPAGVPSSNHIGVWRWLPTREHPLRGIHDFVVRRDQLKCNRSTSPFDCALGKAPHATPQAVSAFRHSHHCSIRPGPGDSLTS